MSGHVQSVRHLNKRSKNRDLAAAADPCSAQKRFSQGKYRRSKADTEVVYPLLGLDMAPYISVSS